MLFIFVLLIQAINFAVYANVIVLPSRLDREKANEYVKKVLNNHSMSTSCKRTCVIGENRLCHFHFNIEHYQAMGAACKNCSVGNAEDCFSPQCVPMDGIEKGILTINRRIPGPLIEVCEGDLVIVDVMNMLHSETTSIHWHGLLQKGTPYADGVPHITQCAITPMATFRYLFWADDVGTYFYHSHSGMQKFNGIYGGFIIRQPAESEFALRPPPLYDVDDNVIILSDWSHESPDMFMVGLPTRPPGSLPTSIVINGKGKFFDTTRNSLTNSPYEIIYVKPGKDNRIRIIGATSGVCPIEIQIQHHRMKVIATDGSPIIPIRIDKLVLTSGERYDIVLKANRASEAYWIYTTLGGLCASANISQWAVLSYNPNLRNSDIKSQPIRLNNSNIVLNEPTTVCGSTPNSICASELNSAIKTNLVTAKVDQTFYMNFGFRDYDSSTFFNQNQYIPFWNIAGQTLTLATVNGISSEFPVSPLLSQPKIINHIELCNIRNLPPRCINSTIACRCTHTVTIKRNSVVEFVLIDENPEIIPLVHPIHFHGFKFAVMTQGTIPNNGSLTIDQVKRLYKSKLLRPYNQNPPLKDTVIVPSQGYTIIRFLADNPGIWLVHCHVEDHMLFGMVFTIIVDGPVPAPPRGYPTCGDFMYD